MKILEKVLDKRLRNIIHIDNMQFGFSQGKGTTGVMLVIRQVQEKRLEKNKKVFMAFLDLEKAYDRVPREVVYWSLRKRGLPKYPVMMVEATYKGARTRVKTEYGKTDAFDIRVGVHQGIGIEPIFVYNHYGHT